MLTYFETTSPSLYIMPLKWIDTLVRTLLLILLLVTLVNSAQYSDIQAIGAICPGRDNCFVSRTTNAQFLHTSCECDSECHMYNDCCVDAPPKPSSKVDVVCLPYNSTFFLGVYVINRCQRHWRGPSEVQQKCENVEDISDPLISAPATDVGGRISYKNRYCAECNRAKLERLVTWNVKIDCTDFMLDSETNVVDNKTAYIMQHLTYETRQNKWGVNYWNSGELRHKFYPCEVSYVLPKYLEGSTRLCRYNLTSTCALNWTRLNVKRKCEAYTAVIYAGSESYRNPHCALCNYVPLSNITCEPAHSVTYRGKTELSFTLLLDVNMSDGNRVGLTRDTTECPSGQKWDPFFKKCRKLVCALPGYEMVNGRCARRSK